MGPAVPLVRSSTRRPSKTDAIDPEPSTYYGRARRLGNGIDELGEHPCREAPLAGGPVATRRHGVVRHRVEQLLAEPEAPEQEEHRRHEVRLRGGGTEGLTQEATHLL